MKRKSSPARCASCGISPPLTAWHSGDAIMVHPAIGTVGGKPFR